LILLLIFFLTASEPAWDKADLFDQLLVEEEKRDEGKV